MSDRAPLIHAPHAEAAALMVGLLNSIVVDFAARSSVGGTDLSYFIIKQLPITPPDECFQPSRLPGLTYAELIVPRVLELTYTAWDLEPFARDLGYDGPPFAWDEARRHRRKCELDAIVALLYRLDQLLSERLIDPGRLIGDLSFRSAAGWRSRVRGAAAALRWTWPRWTPIPTRPRAPRRPARVSSRAHQVIFPRSQRGSIAVSSGR